MKSFLVIVCSLACAYAVVVPDPVSTVLRSAYELTPEGNFQYGYETDNGISVSADGKVKTFGKDEVALEIVGSNQYTAPSGEKIELTYIANENGYQPQGAHLPVPPEPLAIPEYIVRALKYIEEHPYKGETYVKKP